MLLVRVGAMLNEGALHVTLFHPLPLRCSPGSIIKAVNRWASVDNDAAVFGRILRSEVSMRECGTSLGSLR